MRTQSVNRNVRCGAHRAVHGTSRVEPLEQRVLFAAVAWDGDAGDGLWNTPANWSNDQMPGVQDDVSINLPGFGDQVILSGAPASVRSLTIDGGSLRVATELSLAESSHVNPSCSIEIAPGGTLAGDGDFVVIGWLDWTGGTMTGAGETRVSFPGRAYVYGPDPKDLRRTLFVERALELSSGDLRLRDATLKVSGNFDIYGGSILADGGDNRVLTSAQLYVSGSATIGVPLTHSYVGIINGSLTLSGGGSADGPFQIWDGGEVRVSGPGFRFAEEIDGGSLRFEGGGASSLSGPVSVDAVAVGSGAELDVRGAGAGVVSIEGGGRVRLLGDGRLYTRALTFGSNTGTGTPDGVLDVGAGSVIIDYDAATGSPLGEICGLLASGHAGGNWSGKGIVSSLADAAALAVGYGEASSLAALPPIFDGADGTAVLLRSTRYGDADLDGLVTLSDFNRLAANFGRVERDWSQGDFTYDGVANLTDFNRLAANFGGGAATVSLPAPVLAGRLAFGAPDHPTHARPAPVFGSTLIGGLEDVLD